MSRRSNCLFAALRLWLAMRARAYLWCRRSLHFMGAVLHCGVACYSRDGIVVIEYVPPKAKLWTRDNFLILFKGDYRVWTFKLSGVRRFHSREELEQYLKHF